MSDAAENSGRDKQGRFTPGNPGGPGGSRKRAFTLRRAAEESVTEEHIAALMRKATRLALEGNLSAMRLVLERTCGRTADPPTDGEALAIQLPPLQSATDCNLALERIVAGVCAGTLDRENAKLLIDAVNARLKAIEIIDQEQRLAALEETARRVAK